MIREVVNTDSHPAAVQRGNSLVLVFRGQPEIRPSGSWFLRMASGLLPLPYQVRVLTGPGAGALNATLLVAWKALDPDYELHFRLG